MKKLKTIDYAIQIALIAGAIIATLGTYFVKSNDDFFDVMMGSYCVVGGWQLLSVGLHVFVPAQNRIRLRKVYLWLLLFTVVIGLLSLTNGSFVIGFLFGLLFWSPVLAVIYIVTCIKETNLMKQGMGQAAA